MSENSLPLPENTAVQPQETKPHSDTENQPEPSPVILSDDARARAEHLVAEAKQAEIEGDQAKIAEVSEAIQNDPELQTAIEKHQENLPHNEQKTEQDLAALRKTADPLIANALRMADLAQQTATDRRGSVSTASLLQNSREIQEFKDVQKRFDNDLQAASTIDEAERAVNSYMRWYQQIAPMLDRRGRALSEYYNHRPPAILLDQIRILESSIPQTRALRRQLEMSKTNTT